MFIGGNSVEIKTEIDGNDITEYTGRLAVYDATFFSLMYLMFHCL